MHPKENEIKEMLVLGIPRREIAKKLHVSEHTITNIKKTYKISGKPMYITISFKDIPGVYGMICNNDFYQAIEQKGYVMYKCAITKPSKTVDWSFKLINIVEVVELCHNWLKYLRERYAKHITTISFPEKNEILERCIKLEHAPNKPKATQNKIKSLKRTLKNSEQVLKDMIEVGVSSIESNEVIKHLKKDIERTKSKISEIENGR